MRGKLGALGIVENLPLHMCSCVGFVKFMGSGSLDGESCLNKA